MGKWSVAVAGATGYAGGEIVRILASHPECEVTCVAGHSSAGSRFGDLMPHIPTLADMVVQDTTPETLNGHDVVVLALPHGASGAIAAELDPDAYVIDLGADHRLESQEDWDAFYGGDFYGSWEYGLPELILGPAGAGEKARQRDRLAGARRIAAAGCNVTAVTLAMQPAMANGLVDASTLVADLAVGYSGAGKNLKRTNLLASEAINSAVPYSVGGTHRHIPEILQNLRHAAGEPCDAAICFTPMLVPMSRGILASVSACMSERAKAMSDADIRQAWLDAYADEYFIDVLPEGMLPATQNVLGSNAAHVQVAADRASGRIQAFAAIDNLNRGTAGQAVQSLNIALGLDESTGLTKIGVAP